MMVYVKFFLDAENVGAGSACNVLNCSNCVKKCRTKTEALKKCEIINDFKNSVYEAFYDHNKVIETKIDNSSINALEVYMKVTYKSAEMILDNFISRHK